MLDHTGMNRIEYEDVLRAIGYFIDKNNLREICIIELKEGLLVRGVAYTAERSGYQTISESFLFTNEDIERIVNDSYARRGTERPGQPPAQQGQGDVKPQRGFFGR